MYKILIADKLAQEGVDLLETIDGVEPVVKTGMSEDELVEVIGEYDGIIVRSATKVNARVLEAATKLKGIARAGVGVDNIDIPEATKRGVIVMNTPGGNTLSAAEHTMALMLGLSRNVVPACNSLKAGAWDRKKYMGNQLNKKTLGLIGTGRIGLAVAKMSIGFGMKVIGYDPFAAVKEAEELGVEITDDLERIYREADYISLHVPRNEQTTNMISADQLKMMKSTARIVNCARGGIINEADLYAALKDGVIAGAAIDVFPTEPPENTGFADVATCLVTPHLGASTEEAQIEVAVEAAQILADAIKGGAVQNALNAPSSGSLPPLVSTYSELARRIGSVMSTINAGPIKSVELTYRGEIANAEFESVTTAFSIGLLQANVDVPVNVVNVGILAKERGINIAETKNTEAKDVSSSFTAKVAGDKATRSIRGSVFGNDIMKIIEVDGFDVEVKLEGTIVIVYNDDKPGAIGAVCTACGNHGVNISTIGHDACDGKAVFAISCDEEPCEAAIDEIKAIDFVNEVHACKVS